ncbi:trihydroxytoluene oxygenase [Hypoxylon cercidicola]|nr:trihydroxytoluene oxygenase [Hypoxylon cercidicola]
MAPAPNSGSSIQSSEAWPGLKERQESWRARLNIDESQHIRLVELNHVIYQHVDVEREIEFLGDFGFEIVKRADKTIWFGGYGPHPYSYVFKEGESPKFLGGTFTVESYSDLERAAKRQNATPIQKLEDAPGGGFLVTIYDPAGFPINLLWGQMSERLAEQKPNIDFNYEKEKHRLGAYQRFKRGPAAVYRVGHFGICYNNLDEAFDFYVRTFNMVPSDIVFVQPGEKKQEDVSAFFHLDRGELFTDHHTFFIGRSPKQRVHHCSFEVHDFDTQLLGHQWLERKNYKPVWGVGRHLLGSQIFDYWWDTSGFMVEHYADGDLVNKETPVGRIIATDENMQVWGPDRPVEFLA